MKSWKITASSKNLDAVINLPGSKSLSNRALILQKIISKLNAEPIVIQNLSDADDTIIMQEALGQSKGIIDIKNAGTCMRFLTAYFAATPGSEIILNCDARMKERPIAGLVNVLKQLGANIVYLEKENFPPLKITGSKLTGGAITMEAHETSQFMSAIMMVAPLMVNPLIINLNNHISSFDYIEMTQNLMKEFGFQMSIQNEPNYQIIINNTFSQKSSMSPLSYNVEPDWSSAAFIYEAAALSETAKIFLPKLSKHSKQGDRKIAGLMLNLGVTTIQHEDGILIRKSNNAINILPEEISLVNHPDLAPPLISAAAALGLPYTFSGLASLKVKESNRLLNLKQALNNLGYPVEILENDCLQCTEHKLSINSIEPNLIETENDHRLVMCYALLALKNNNILLSEVGSVEKSFPGFWEEMRKLGIVAEECF